MRNSLTLVENADRKVFFFSDKHTDFGLKGFVPVTYTIPQQVKPRLGFESGWLETPDDIVKLYLRDYTDITNTDEVLEAITDPKLR